MSPHVQCTDSGNAIQDTPIVVVGGWRSGIHMFIIVAYATTALEYRLDAVAVTCC